jgi:hypothetical protein
MSEYTDYMALLTDVQTLQDLRGALEQEVRWAIVEPPVGTTMQPSAAEAAWQALPKPAWVVLTSSAAGPDDLVVLGTVFQLVVEEDFASWGLIMRCGGDAWNYAMRTDVTFGDSILDREPPLQDPSSATDRVTALADCLDVDPAALAATLVPDGGQAFSSLLGVEYFQMLDANLISPGKGGVMFPWDVKD